MKKIFLVAFAVLSFSIANAQVRIKPGVRAGYSNADISDIRGENRSSFYLGADINFRFAKWYALQPELNYSRQGMKVRYIDSFDPIAPSYEEKWKLDYLGLTLANKFYVFRGLNLQVSPYLDFVINTKNVNPTNDVDTGIALGIGYDFKNGLGIEARLKSGGVDIFDDYGTDDDDTDYLHLNGALQIGVTYTFDLKKK